MEYPSSNINDVEAKIRNAAQVRCARTDEYLKDFDRLRTGYITKVQLKRCLDQHYGIVLEPLEEDILMAKYGSDRQKPGMFNYRDFCAVIDKGFEATTYPKEQSKTSPNVISRRPISPELNEKSQQILTRIAPHYEYHGINVKSCYEDFDKHNIGTITESQFYRSFPGPSDVQESEMRLLARKYRHPTKQGMCNYLDFHQDIVETQNELNSSKMAQKDIEFTEDEFITTKSRKETDLQGVFSKIRVAVHKNGIRTTEFFRDHDKLRSGIITENQFVCGLSLCCGSQASLTRDEIQLLVNFYKLPDGRVRYKEFCDSMENAFTIPHLEKNPTAVVYRPQVGELAKVPNTLSPAEEDSVMSVLTNLRDIVQKKRLMIYPYFKDFDRAKGYTRCITKTQFSRMLHMVGLDVSQADLELLARKFDCGGDVYYPAFIQAIDSEYVGTAELKQNSSSERSSSIIGTPTTPVTKRVDLAAVVGRIRHHVLVNSLRIEEFFQDFDPLRHGSISESRFRMGLSAMGSNLSEAEFKCLTQTYADPKRSGNVLWNDFLLDIEIVFTKRGLEKTPRYTVATSKEFVMQKPGTINWESTSAEKRQILDSAMSRMRETAKQRRVLAKPCFQDFDRHNKGYVTKSQFCQCLTSLCLNASKEEMDVIIEKYADDTGFNYVRFLEDLQPSEKTENKYIERLKELELVNKKEIKDSGSAGIVHVMNKIRTKVVKERIRVEEFMRDYDKLRTGRLLKSVFPRAIDLCQLGLVKSEVEDLMTFYESLNYPDYVDYTQFCDDVESVFTVKGLEKNPLYDVKQFRPPPDSENNKLAENAENMLETVMHRLADRVRIRRIQIFPLFEDYDRVHNGSVSRSQFHRVLSELELGSLVSAREFDVLYKKFDIMIGGKHDFNYIGFCDMINEYAQFEYGKP
eukprot:gene8232-14169_t